MLEYCVLGAMDSILKDLDRGLGEETIKIVTKQALEVCYHKKFLNKIFFWVFFTFWFLLLRPFIVLLAQFIPIFCLDIMSFNLNYTHQGACKRPLPTLAFFALCPKSRGQQHSRPEGLVVLYILVPGSCRRADASCTTLLYIIF